ncbi:711_t:CDS:2, partial [Acaulospora morrowiae]
QDYSSLLDHRDEFYDVIIQVGNEDSPNFFRAHSVVLWARSQYFREKLSRVDKDSFRNVITISLSNISAEQFGVLLRYIYTGTIALEKYKIEDMILLMMEAKQLLLPEFVDYVQEYLIDHQNLIINNYFSINKFIAKYSGKLDRLVELCNRILIQNPMEVINSPQFLRINQRELSQFLEIFSNTSHSPLHPEASSNGITLLDICLSDTNLPEATTVKDTILWNKLVDWGATQLNLIPSKISEFGDDDCLYIKQVIEPYLPFINFENISSVEFREKVTPIRKVLDNKFYVELLEAYAEMESEHETRSHNGSTYSRVSTNQRSVSKQQKQYSGTSSNNSSLNHPSDHEHSPKRNSTTNRRLSNNSNRSSDSFGKNSLQKRPSDHAYSSTNNSSSNHPVGYAQSSMNYPSMSYPSDYAHSSTNNSPVNRPWNHEHFSKNNSLSDHSHHPDEQFEEDLDALEEFMRPLPKIKINNETTRSSRNRSSKNSRAQRHRY